MCLSVVLSICTNCTCELPTSLPVNAFSPDMVGVCM